MKTRPQFKFTYLLIFLSFFNLAHIFSQEYSIENFEVEIQADEYGKMTILETISVDFFVEKRGIYRDIPTLFKLNGESYKIKISQVQVSGFQQKVTDTRGKTNIRIGDPDIFLTGKQVYEISYVVEGAIIEYETGQEIYWNLTGNEWDVPIKKSTFKIVLPIDISLESSRMKVYTGIMGSKSSSANIFQTNDRTIEGSSSSVISPGEGITVALNLPIGYFQNLKSLENKSINYLTPAKNKPWFMLFPLGVLGLIIGIWRRIKNKNISNEEIPFQYYPPNGLTSAHVGAFIDHSVQTRDVVSLIPYWATEGHLHIKGLEDGDKMLIKQRSLPDDYPEYEKEFFNSIFILSDNMKFSDAKFMFGDKYNFVRRSLTKEIEAAGYYDESYCYWFKTFRWALICFIVLGLGAIAIWMFHSLIVGIGLIVVSIILLCLYLFTAPLSEYGREVHRHLKGLESFLKSDNGEKVTEILKTDPDYFGKILPFAVALGLDKQWIANFQERHEFAPIWYIGHSVHSRPAFSEFSTNFEVKEITQAFTTSPIPESTSSSSSGGGGFSGGGFGGGGGGSW